MAYYGLSNPWIAKYDVEANTYSDGFKCGKAVGTNVTPQYSNAKLYGDNRLVEEVNEFKNADVTLDVTELPLIAANVMFGHTIDNEAKKVVYKTNDVANYVGYGFYASELIDGKTTYIAVVLTKVKFAESAEGYNTKGDSIEFKNPALTGTGMANNNGEWKIKQTFEKEDEAVEFIKTTLNIAKAA